MISETPQVAWRFGRFVLDLRRGALLADGAERALRPKSFALLRYLVENAERLIGRDEIMRAVWPDTFVTEDSITQCVREIRRVLDDEAQALLRTLPRRGYLLAIPAAPLDRTVAAPALITANPVSIGGTPYAQPVGVASAAADPVNAPETTPAAPIGAAPYPPPTAAAAAVLADRLTARGIAPVGGAANPPTAASADLARANSVTAAQETAAAPVGGAPVPQPAGAASGSVSQSFGAALAPPVADVTREPAARYAGGVAAPAPASTAGAAAAFNDLPTLPAPPTGRPMVVVLPLENIGGDPEQGYFADGVTADLVTDLTHFQDLHVVSPPRPGGPPPPSLDDLPSSARYLFSGSVRRSGGRIRIAVRLGDAHTGINLWAERFDRPLDDLFAVQEDLSSHIAALVDSQVGRESLRRARHRPPANLDAYDLYLHGRDLNNRTTEADTLLARQMFDRAIAADPHYAPAYAYQAYTVHRGFTLGWGEPRGRAALVPALELARRGVALEPGSSLCMMRLAFILALLGRHDEAVETGRKGVAANPCDAAGRATLGEVLSMAGAHDAGVVELRLAVSLNPFHPPFWWATLGRALVLAGRGHEALVELRRCVAGAPDYRPCHSSMVVACVETGDADGARAAMREVLRLRPGWALRNYDGVFGFRMPADTARFLAAFRAAGMPES